MTFTYTLEGLTPGTDYQYVAYMKASNKEIYGTVQDFSTAAINHLIDLSTLTGDYEAQDGDTLTGTLGYEYYLTIASGAHIYLYNADINGSVNWQWEDQAGLTCLGDAEITLVGTNIICSMGEDNPAIQAGPTGTTLTINGEGQLTANCKDGYEDGCYGAAIGNGSYEAACGNIVISGGNIIAKGGYYAAAIGGADDSSCGNITITDGVTLTAERKGNWSPYTIGKGRGSGTCGTITIGGTVRDGITDNPYVFPEPAPATPEGAIIGKFTVDNTGKQVYFAKGNLIYDNGSWKFHEHQYDRCFTADANLSDGNGNSDILCATGTFDIFPWGTSGVAGSATIYQPWITMGPGAQYRDDVTIAGAILPQGLDWGHNPITNGGNQTDQWRTLSRDEWNYLLGNNQSNHGTVGGVYGLIVLPDNWVCPAGITFVNHSKAWTDNVYTLEQWALMESAGAAFLPTSGILNGFMLEGVNTDGYYWTSANFITNWGPYNPGNSAFFMGFNNSGQGYDPQFRSYGMSVRLVQDVQ